MIGTATESPSSQTDCSQSVGAGHLDRDICRQRMEHAAAIVRRLAHDFGNFLTGILGFSELALSQQAPTSSPLHSYLEEIHRGAQNAAHYTNQLRLFARRNSPCNRSCHLAEALAAEENRLQAARGANVQIKNLLPNELPAIAVERELLQQLLAVVLENAWEASTGPGVIEVSAAIVQLEASEAQVFIGAVRPGIYVEIRISDSGGGLTPEAQRQLFAEPFFSTKSPKRGFGLAMAYGILSSHRGGLDLLNRPEGGTIARLIVPVAELSAPIAPSASQRIQTNERILIVDDDPMILHVIQRTLEPAGFRIHTAATAAEALRAYNAADADPFRLVVSDVLMPEMNGVELAQRLMAQNAKVPILFMSGEIDTEMMQQCFGSGRVDFLPKPFRPDGLLRAVRAAIDAPRANS